MADIKVSALAAGTGITDADLFYYVDGATSKKVTGLILQDYVLEGVDLIASNYNLLFYSENTALTTGQENTFYGYQAGKSNTSAWVNVFIGYKSGYTNTTKQRNTYIGYKAGYANNEDDNVIIGDSTGICLTSGTDNVIIGSQAVSDAASLTVSGCVIIGKEAGQVCTANDNVFIGHQCGEDNTSGTDNTYIGYRAGANSVIASRCVCIGHYAGENNNTNDLLFIGNSNTATPLIWGNFANNILTVHGQLGINIKTPATSAAVDITSTTGALLVPRMNSTEMVALTEVNGMIVYNTSLNAFCFYENGAWQMKVNI